jgi:hypothetical protein
MPWEANRRPYDNLTRCERYAARSRGSLAQISQLVHREISKVINQPVRYIDYERDCSWTRNYDISRRYRIKDPYRPIISNYYDY